MSTINNLTDFIKMDNAFYMQSNLLAKYVEKRHDHVLVDIKNLVEFYNEIYSPEKSGELCKSSTYKDNSGKFNKCYLLSKDAAIDLVTGYSLKHRHAVNQRWVELEQVVQIIADENHVTKEQLIQEKLNAQFAKAKAMKEIANLKLEAVKAKHKQTMELIEAKTTKLLAQGAKIKGDMSIGKVIMPRSTITSLLRKNNCVADAKDANYALVLLGYLDTKRKLVTASGSLYGLSNKAGNGNASQALWFDSEFDGLYTLIERKLIEVGIFDNNGKYFPKDTE